jgi:hypothetical protein
MVTLASPTLTSPPPIHGSTSRALQTPGVGEFKGWFTNLFGWKGNQQPPSGTGVLYAPETVSKTHADVRRFMHSLGVTVEEAVGDGAEVLALRCRVDDATSGTLGAPNGLALLGQSKSVRFRVQFSTASQQQQVFGAGMTSPRISRSIPATPVPGQGGDLTAIMLIHEKGSSTTFKAVWRRLKDAYESATLSGGSGTGYYPCLSPTVGATPTIEQTMRFAM